MSREEQENEIIQAIANMPDEASQIDFVMEKRGCFGNHHLDDNDEYRAIIQDYLKNDLDASDTTQKLLAPIDHDLSSNKEDVYILDLWYIIIHSAKRLPFRDTTGLIKLVDLVKAIKSHPPPSTATQTDIYSNLSGLSMATRETMNDCPGCGCGYLLPEAHAYANMLYFYALLTREGILNCWIYCIWEMREALEKPHKDDAATRYLSSNSGTAVQKYNAQVPAAAVWVFALGKELYQREIDLTPKSKLHGRPALGGPLWKGGQEFSKERWALWKKRFGEVAEMEGLSEEVRGIAREAFGVMDDCERA